MRDVPEKVVIIGSGPAACTAAIYAARADLEVALGFSASDRPAQDPTLDWFAKGLQIAGLVAGRDIGWLWPLAEITKPQIIAALPDELLALTWSCRRPRRGRPCGRCLTCRRLDGERTEAARIPKEHARG